MTLFTRTGLPALLALTLLAGPAFAQDATPPAAATPPVPAASAPATPSNEVGEKFEIPRVGGKEQQLSLLSGLCGVQMKAMSPAGCACLAEQAMTSLSDPQRDYLIATAVAPPVADRMLNDGRVGQSDQELIFRFISATTEGCASGTFDAEKQKAAMIPASPAPAAAPAVTAPAPVPAAPSAPAASTPAPAN